MTPQLSTTTHRLSTLLASLKAATTSTQYTIIIKQLSCLKMSSLLTFLCYTIMHVHQLFLQVQLLGVQPLGDLFYNGRHLLQQNWVLLIRVVCS
jgi:hypothetical protein